MQWEGAVLSQGGGGLARLMVHGYLWICCSQENLPLVPIASL